MTKRQFGFGIIGCGVIAPFHVRAIADLPDARLVAVADNEVERARDLASAFDIDQLEVDALLARPDIDVVCVCVPSGAHAEIGARAAAAGKHVVVEKPIEVTLEAADRLISACDEHGVTLSVISQHRWDQGVRDLKELVDSRRLGRLVLGDAIVKWYRTQQYYESGNWRGTVKLDGGGALMNQGVHYVDLLQWVMGPVEHVFARARTSAHEGIEVEDNRHRRPQLRQRRGGSSRVLDRGLSGAERTPRGDRDGRDRDRGGRRDQGPRAEGRKRRNVTIWRKDPGDGRRQHESGGGCQPR